MLRSVPLESLPTNAVLPSRLIQDHQVRGPKTVDLDRWARNFINAYLVTTDDER